MTLYDTQEMIGSSPYVKEKTWRINWIEQNKHAQDNHEGHSITLKKIRVLQNKKRSPFSKAKKSEGLLG